MSKQKDDGKPSDQDVAALGAAAQAASNPNIDPDVRDLVAKLAERVVDKHKAEEEGK